MARKYTDYVVVVQSDRGFVLLHGLQWVNKHCKIPEKHQEHPPAQSIGTLPFSIVVRSEVHAIRSFERGQGRSASWVLLLPERIRSVPRVKGLPRGFVCDGELDQWRECVGSRMFGRVKGAQVGPGRRLIKWSVAGPLGKEPQSHMCAGRPLREVSRGLRLAFLPSSFLVKKVKALRCCIGPSCRSC